jgi:hypothetical protein
MRRATLPMLAGLRLLAAACLPALLLVPAVSPALAQEDVSRFVPLKGMLMPLLDGDRAPVGMLRLDLSIEALRAEDVPVISALSPRIRDALLTQVPPPVPADGLNLTSTQLTDFKRRVLLAIRRALGSTASVSDIHFVNVLTMPG